MRKRLLVSAIAVVMLLHITTYTDATEPTKQIIIEQEDFKPFIEDNPDLVIPVVIYPTATPKPTPKPKKVVTKPKVLVYKSTKTYPASITKARQYALSRIGQKQFNCLDTLWNRESGWRTTAENKSSGAYGIPQALPGSKMASAGDDWRTNPVTQVKWGLKYISGRYGSSCNALQHFYNTGWY